MPGMPGSMPGFQGHHERCGCRRGSVVGGGCNASYESDGLYVGTNTSMEKHKNVRTKKTGPLVQGVTGGPGNVR
jgi:hypothetical protein